MKNLKPIPALPLKDIERFYNCVDVDEITDCHLWTGSIDPNGYGIFFINRESYRAHRVSWAINETAPDVTLTIDHLCRVRNCVNPEHLELVSLSENTHRMQIANYRSHCPRGHELSGRNLIAAMLQTSGRACRSCDNASRRARHHGLQGTERELFIQRDADQRYSKIAQPELVAA